MPENNKSVICSYKEIAEIIIKTANKNEKHCESDTCLLICSVLRDCGYQIKRIISETNSNPIKC